MQIADLRIFLAVSSAGSLSAAARQLNLGPMQVSRRIAVLEQELGVRLFHRTTRSVALTAEGEAFFPYANTMSEAEESARGALSPAPATASGTLKLTAPSVFGQTIILPFLPALLERHPDLRIDLDLSDRVLDIVGQGLDLALRIATLEDSELVARRIAGNPRIICAAPDYLRRYGVPARLADLDDHQCIVLHSVPRWPVLVHDELHHEQRRRRAHRHLAGAGPGHAHLLGRARAAAHRRAGGRGAGRRGDGRPGGVGSHADAALRARAREDLPGRAGTGARAQNCLTLTQFQTRRAMPAARLQAILRPCTDRLAAGQWMTASP
jgi:DNA-binding transcriptional LysR family regulator